MAKKTWVKLKRGLLTDPKHRLALGNRIWLYMYMLDVTDWNTGKILEWRDKDAADELDMPLVTVRTQRREIEAAGYISCKQLHNRQEITIKRWVNPREYSGKVYNTDAEELDEADGDEKSLPCQNGENSHGDNKGVNEGVNDGDQYLTLLHINHISHITDQYANREIDLFEACVMIYEKLVGYPIYDPASFSLMIENFNKNDVIAEDYANAIIAMRNDPKYKRATKPTSYEKYTLGIAEKRNNPVSIKHTGGENEPARKLIWAHEE